MNISKEMNDFLTLSSRLSNSIILLTDSDKFIFCSDSNCSYLNNYISNELSSIVKSDSDESYLKDSSSVINLINTDTNYYKSQIILPIHTSNYKGLLIFFNTDREYINSNLDFAKTTKHFVEIFFK